MSDQRYSRQVLFAPLGSEGQARIESAQAVLVGCGALGSTIANALVRAGIGQLTMVDDDRLELSNLQRQTLYDEAQVKAGLAKAQAAHQRLAQINSAVQTVPLVERVSADNISHIIGQPDLVLDGTDNFATRYLLNDYCVSRNIPWVYGGCAASYGVAMSIIPGRTPCLRCIFPEPPPPELAPTADTVGIIGPIAHLVASIESAEGLKILSGNSQAIKPALYTIDLWDSTFSQVRLPTPEPACRCCGQGKYDYLNPSAGAAQ